MPSSPRSETGRSRTAVSTGLETKPSKPPGCANRRDCCFSSISIAGSVGQALSLLARSSSARRWSDRVVALPWLGRSALSYGATAWWPAILCELCRRHAATPKEEEGMLLATTQVEDFDRFVKIF